MLLLSSFKKILHNLACHPPSLFMYINNLSLPSISRTHFVSWWCWFSLALRIENNKENPTNKEGQAMWAWYIFPTTNIESFGYKFYLIILHKSHCFLYSVPGSHVLEKLHNLSPEWWLLFVFILLSRLPKWMVRTASDSVGYF